MDNPSILCSEYGRIAIALNVSIEFVYGFINDLKNYTTFIYELVIFNLLFRINIGN
jgi:hypothetical protein